MHEVIKVNLCDLAFLDSLTFTDQDRRNRLSELN